MASHKPSQAKPSQPNSKSSSQTQKGTTMQVTPGTPKFEIPLPPGYKTQQMPMPSARHPLQRFGAPSRGMRNSDFEDEMLTSDPPRQAAGLSSFAGSFKFNASYGWHFQYLTIIGLTLASLTFLCGSLADITLSRPIFRTKNILSICSAPLAVLISSLYWGIKSIDASLVVPEWAILDPLVDIGFHAIPALALTLDLLFFSPPWTIDLSAAFLLSSFLAGTYWFWVELCFTKNGFYPYPLFEQLSTPWRGVLFTGCAVAMAGVTVVLKGVYGVLNRGGKGRGVKRVLRGREQKVGGGEKGR
ncbi:hypothetical protein MMC25_003866 [Agyrium rufum]|nr:hypothetical protein [Agyrium rufum]